MRFGSIRSRLAAGFGFLFLGFLVLASYLALRAAHALHVGEERSVRHEIAHATLTALQGTDWRRMVDQEFSGPQAKARALGGVITDRSGRVLWKSRQNAPTLPLADGSNVAVMKQGEFVLYLGPARLPHSERQSLHALVMLSVAAVVAVGVGSWQLVGRTLSPIRALAQQAASASVDKPGLRLTSPSADREMVELVSTLNGFLSRMEDSTAEKERFYAAASHELRTPLQALSGHLEVCLSQPRSPLELQQALQEAHVQTQRLVSLVESVLLLQQLQGSAIVEREEVAVGLVVAEILSRYEPLIEVRALNVELRQEGDPKVRALPNHVAILVRNLVDNAIKHGAESGDIVIELSAGRLSVQNPLLVTSEVDVERLPEPFYREDASRSNETGGNGLGLSICEAICRANGWAFELVRERGRFAARVTF